jgi:hypothetical protein
VRRDANELATGLRLGPLATLESSVMSASPDAEKYYGYPIAYRL